MTTTRTLIAAAALSLAAIGVAQADEYYGSDRATAVQSGTTRTAVRNELAQFKKAGVNPWSTSYNPLGGFQSTKTRAQVTSEYLADRDAVAAMGSEDSGSLRLAQRKAPAPVFYAVLPR